MARKLGVFVLTIALSAVLVAVAGPAKAADDCAFDVRNPSVGLGLVPALYNPPATETWQGTGWQSQNVAFPSAATGAKLCATLFAPNPLPSGTVPAVVIVNASGPAVQPQYHWAARALADHGYIAITIDPQGQGKSDTFKASGTGNAVSPATCNWTQVPTLDNPSPCPGVPFQQFENFTDAVESGIDYITSSANPWLSKTDTTKIGAAGHSMGARAVSYMQGVDTRIDAVVAWDNLSSTTEGDNGSASGGWPMSSVIGGEVPGIPVTVTPRVPAMGQASEYTNAARLSHPLVLDEPTRVDANPEWKKTAYELWRGAGIDTMQVVFDGSVHGSWAQGPWSPRATWAPLAQQLEYYTRAWFDRWLKGDTTATDRLLAMTVNGAARGDVLSDLYYSGAAFDGLNCPNLEDPSRPTTCDR